MKSCPPPSAAVWGFLLASIALWFIGYNAIETWFTTFADKMWGMALGDATLCLTIATAGAICSTSRSALPPAGEPPPHYSVRRTAATACFGSGYVYTLFNNTFHPALYALFAPSWRGLGFHQCKQPAPWWWKCAAAAMSANLPATTTPASMAAQTITPIVAGWLLKHVSYSVLFLYSAIFVALAFFTMLMVRHGDVKVGAAWPGSL